jgi:hypothetical protein
MSSSGKKSSTKKLKPALRTGSPRNKTGRHIVINEGLNTTDQAVPFPRTHSTQGLRWWTPADEAGFMHEYRLGRDEGSVVARKAHDSANARRNVPRQAAMAARRKFNITNVGDTSAERARAAVHIATRAERSLMKSRARSRRAHEELAKASSASQGASSASQGASSASRRATGPIPHPKPSPSIRDEPKPIPAPRAQGPISSAVSSVFGYFTGRKGGKRTRKNRKQKK